MTTRAFLVPIALPMPESLTLLESRLLRLAGQDLVELLLVGVVELGEIELGLRVHSVELASMLEGWLMGMEWTEEALSNRQADRKIEGGRQRHKNDAGDHPRLFLSSLQNHTTLFDSS